MSGTFDFLGDLSKVNPFIDQYADVTSKQNFIFIGLF